MSTTAADVLLARLRVGVSMASSGPRAVHLRNELYDSQLDQTPVVAILRQANRSAMGGHHHGKLAEVLSGHPQ